MLASASTTPSRPVDATSQIKASHTYRQAICLARRMRDALRPHTKDRKWNFKTYKNCFMASHAVSWAMDNFDVDEKMAVDRLNQLVNFGLLMHVVDPSKEFLVGESNTLYFRMAGKDVLDADISHQADSSAPLVKTNSEAVGNNADSAARRLTTGSKNADVVTPKEIQQRLEKLDHALQHTVKELNGTRGRLEFVQQEVLGLVSQQISMFTMIILMYMYIIFFMVPWSGVGSFGLLVLTVMVVVSTHHGLKCISLWSNLESWADPTEPIDVTDNGSVRKQPLPS